MSSIFQRAFRVVRSRPVSLWQNLRGTALFFLATPLIRFLSGKNLILSPNVRVQNLRSLLCEGEQSQIEIGSHSIVYENARIEAYGGGKIQIGERAVIGDVRIYAREKIEIGKRALFSWNVFLQDFTPHPVLPEERAKQMEYITDTFFPKFKGAPEHSTLWSGSFPTDPIVIGDDVWFGANTTILPGAKIGSGCIIASGAVVTRGEYPSRSVLAGNPAKVVKTV